MTIETLTEDELRCIAAENSSLWDKALHIIDAQAARIAELETLLQRCQNEAADTWGALVTEANARIEELLLQLRYRCPALVAELDAANARADAAGCEWRKAEARVAALRLERDEADESLDAHIARAERAESESTALRAEVERWRAENGSATRDCVGLANSLKATHSSLAEARALLEALRWEPDVPNHQKALIAAWLSGNPESPRAQHCPEHGEIAVIVNEAFYRCGCRRYTESPRAAAERAVLNACVSVETKALRHMATGAWCGHGSDIAEAELARRAVAERLEPAPGFDAAHSAQIRDRMGPAPSDTVDAERRAVAEAARSMKS